MGYDSLQNYYMTNFSLMHHHKYSLTELDNLLPWEKDIYIALLVQELERERLRLQQELNRK